MLASRNLNLNHDTIQNELRHSKVYWIAKYWLWIKNLKCFLNFKSFKCLQLLRLEQIRKDKFANDINVLNVLKIENLTNIFEFRETANVEYSHTVRYL